MDPEDLNQLTANAITIYQQNGNPVGAATQAIEQANLKKRHDEWRIWPGDAYSVAMGQPVPGAPAQ